jgi:hypothetical protein
MTTSELIEAVGKLRESVSESTETTPEDHSATSTA